MGHLSKKNASSLNFQYNNEKFVEIKIAKKHITHVIKQKNLTQFQDFSHRKPKTLF